MDTRQKKALVGLGVGTGVIVGLVAVSNASTPDKAAKRASSPIAGVSASAWRKFVRAMMDPTNAKTMSPGFRAGMFHFGMPRLRDLGLATNVRRGDYLQKSVWLGDFKAPLTMSAFLDSPKVQYQVFVRSTLKYLPEVRQKFGGMIGKETVGARISLSGLLALTHRAGIAGTKEWLSSATDRERYPNTTAAFEKTTGIF